MPSASAVRPSSSPEQSMPWLSAPILAVTSMRRSPGSTAPGSATGTRWPAAMLCAPQTIDERLAGRPTWTLVSDSWSARGCGATSSSSPTTTFCQSAPDALDALDLHAEQRQPLGQRLRLRSKSTYSRSQDSGTRIENCSRKRRSFSMNSADVADAVAQHRDAVGAHAEGEALVALGIDAAVAQHDRMDHARAEDRHPAGPAAGRAADAAADEALDVERNRRLGERVVAGPEAGRPVRRRTWRGRTASSRPRRWPWSCPRRPSGPRPGRTRSRGWRRPPRSGSSGRAAARGSAAWSRASPGSGPARCGCAGGSARARRRRSCPTGRARVILRDVQQLEVELVGLDLGRLVDHEAELAEDRARSRARLRDADAASRAASGRPGRVTSTVSVARRTSSAIRPERLPALARWPPRAPRGSGWRAAPTLGRSSAGQRADAPRQRCAARPCGRGSRPRRVAGVAGSAACGDRRERSARSAVELRGERSSRSTVGRVSRYGPCATSAMRANVAASRTAMSARILRSMATPARFSPLMNLP